MSATRLQDIYRTSLGLLTDLYQLTMAQAAWYHQRHRLRSVFQLTLRQCPFDGDFAVAAGIEPALDYASNLAFEDDDLDYLATLESRSGEPLFHQEFLRYLQELKPRFDIFAVDEGETLLAGSPIVRVEGEYLEAQLLETALLNLIGMPTQVATKAARICHWAARGLNGDSAQPVLEFGLRRAHGIDGGLSASRAAYIGGCAASSNVLAGRLFGIPVSGTHAHSWVLSFEDEIEAFRAYAEAFPQDSILLVDTFNTARGLERAAGVGQELAKRGDTLVGVRLDSGDLSELSQVARQGLDHAGLAHARVAASGDLDEGRIAELRSEGSAIDDWGIGSKLVTSKGDPSFSGAYKLASIEDPTTGRMRGVAKISDDLFKRSLPGRQQVLRRIDAQGRLAQNDLLMDLDHRSQRDELKEAELAKTGREEPLLSCAVSQGERCRRESPINESRERARRCCELLGWNSDWSREGGDPPAHGLTLVVDEAVEQSFAELLRRAEDH